ncbi:MFS transporter [Savagea sp. SN6]|uniref:MFS transporter n=1 Tax=Savagea serpentis TaxID=2785297 RepID=A0A8J7G352_9BACL|nr:MFS transporter [Savagea serpentis]MBF4501355.1 MFS transporter [Savagea serpentis]
MTKSSTNKSWLLIIGIMLIAANLRAPITAVGSLINDIVDDLQLSNAVAGSITTIPLLAFAIFSPFAPKIAQRFGLERTIFYSMIALTIGIFIRSTSSIALLFGGTILLGLAISIGNVLLPGYVKLKFPHQIGLMTGLYAVFMNIFGALASGISVPLSNVGSLGWQGALAVFGGLSLLATIVWMPQLKQNIVPPKVTSQEKKPSLLKSPLAWSVTLFMGTQSLLFYTIVAWLPPMLQTKGYSPESAGWMLFAVQMTIVPVTFIVPIIAGKMKNQFGLAIFTALAFATGIIFLIINEPILILPAVISLGIGAGSAFSLAMMLFTLRTNTVDEAAQLSGMAQSAGYLLAATGPVIFGKLYDLTLDWDTSLYILLSMTLIILFAGLYASQSKTV